MPVVATDICYRFACPRLDGGGEEVLSVVAFEGVEAISEPYTFRVTLASARTDIADEDVLLRPASFTILQEALFAAYNDGLGDPAAAIDAPLVYHGVVTEFEFLHYAESLAFYRATLRPRLWLASRDHQFEVYLDKTYPEIIEAELKRIRLGAADYELRLHATYPTWEYVCQYDEDSLAFLQRLMEREGITYWFEPGDGGERLIIADDASGPGAVEPASVPYLPDSALERGPAVRSIRRRRSRVPKRVTEVDYNYRTPGIFVQGEAEADPDGLVEVYHYGEHLKDEAMAARIATRRAEEIRCRRVRYHGEGNAPYLRAGHRCALTGHFRANPAFNQDYLLLRVRHEGAQPGYKLAGMAEALSLRETMPVYRNEFEALPAETVFRPARRTRRPRIHGALNAVIDLDGVDDQGRYKVRLPFAVAGGEGKASRWCRFAKPYTGPTFGMHYPLHAGTEVLLAFVDGDPDRPIIIHAMENPLHPSVTDDHTVGRLKTATGSYQEFKSPDHVQAVPTLTGGFDFAGFGAMAGAATAAAGRAGEEEDGGGGEPWSSGFVGFGTRAQAGVDLAQTGTYVDGNPDFAESITPMEYNLTNVASARVFGEQSLTQHASRSLRSVAGTLTQQTHQSQNTFVRGDVTVTQEGDQTVIQIGDNRTINIGDTNSTQTDDYDKTVTGNSTGLYVGSVYYYHKNDFSDTGIGTTVTKTTIGPTITNQHGNLEKTTTATVRKNLVGNSYALCLGSYSKHVTGDSNKRVTGYNGKYVLGAAVSLYFGRKKTTVRGVTLKITLGGTLQLMASAAFTLAMAADLKLVAGRQTNMFLGAKIEGHLALVLNLQLSSTTEIKVGPQVESKMGLVELKKVKLENSAAKLNQHLARMRFSEVYLYM